MIWALIILEPWFWFWCQFVSCHFLAVQKLPIPQVYQAMRSHSSSDRSCICLPRLMGWCFTFTCADLRLQRITRTTSNQKSKGYSCCQQAHFQVHMRTHIISFFGEVVAFKLIPAQRPVSVAQCRHPKHLDIGTWSFSNKLKSLSIFIRDL